MEIYLGQFGNYYPGKPAYGYGNAYQFDRGTAASPTGYDAAQGDEWNKGIVVDVVTQDRVETNACASVFYHSAVSYETYGAPMQSMCIAFGRNENAAYRASDGYSGTDHMQAGPMGLGYLVVNGMVADLKAFYCPTYEAPVNRHGSAYGYDMYYNNGLDGGGKGVVNSLRRIAMLGGFSGRDLTHGNYRAAGDDGAANADYVGGGTRATGVGADSSYMYRNFPFCEYNAVPGTKAPVHWTKPFVTSEIGSCPFKTPRWLKGRALVADTFYRNFQDTFGTDPIVPGWGAECHQDGYNVFYGDYHTRWYSDMEQRIMWFVEAPNTYGNAVPATAGYEPFSQYGASYGTPGSCKVMPGYLAPHPTIVASGHQTIFHIFDESAGIDLGTTPCPLP